tara:strand:+ start:943 stop:1257 length:315 start_codon:yes stop_codon:yes gene_type:complete
MENIKAKDLKRGMIVRLKERQVTSMSLGGGNQRKNWIGGEVKKREFIGNSRIKVTFKKGTELYGSHSVDKHGHERYIPWSSHNTDAYEPVWEEADERGRFSYSG